MDRVDPLSLPIEEPVTHSSACPSWSVILSSFPLKPLYGKHSVVAVRAMHGKAGNRWVV